jgi:hypothetical protein
MPLVIRIVPWMFDRAPITPSGILSRKAAKIAKKTLPVSDLVMPAGRPRGGFIIGASAGLLAVYPAACGAILTVQPPGMRCLNAPTFPPKTVSRRREIHSY